MRRTLRQRMITTLCGHVAPDGYTVRLLPPLVAGVTVGARRFLAGWSPVCPSPSAASARLRADASGWGRMEAPEVADE